MNFLFYLLFFVAPCVVLAQEPNITFTIKGVIQDCKTKEPIPDADAHLICADGQSIHSSTNPKGEYQIIVNSKRKVLACILKSSNNPYNYSTSDKYKLTFYDSIENKDTVINFCLVKFEGCRLYIFPTLLYDKNETKLYSIKDNNYELKFFAEILKDNPTFKIQIDAHIGVDEKVQQKLDSLRANSVKDILIAEGIEEERLTVKYWGNQKPNKTKYEIKKLKEKGEREQALKENRRIEFTIVAKDYIPKNSTK